MYKAKELEMEERAELDAIIAQQGREQQRQLIKEKARTMNIKLIAGEAAHVIAMNTVLAEKRHTEEGKATTAMIADVIEKTLERHITIYKRRVLVEVRGGVAEVSRCPDDVEVEIVDHDERKEQFNE